MTEKNKNRFSIDDWHIVDSECTPSKKYYIREILDTVSHEHTSSKLNNQQRRDMITELGFDTLTAVLDDCFRGTRKNPDEYNATKCARLEMFLLNTELDRNSTVTPELADNLPVVMDRAKQVLHSDYSSNRSARDILQAFVAAERLRQLSRKS